MIDYSFSIQELEYFLLILVRTSCFVFAAPFWGENTVPGRVKIGTSVFIAILLYYATAPHEVLMVETIIDLTTIILKEAAAGLLIGLGANICTSVVLFAGRLVDVEMGLGMANIMDPTSRENATITGVYYRYMVMLIMIISGMYQYLISALAETFTLIPVGDVVINYDKILDSFIVFMGEYMLIGLRICLPVFCTIMLLNAVLGILAKVAPQMNMFAVGIQLKVLTGMAVLFFSVAMLPRVSDLIYTHMRQMIVRMVEGLMNAGI